MDGRSDEITINDCLRATLTQLLSALPFFLAIADFDIGHPDAKRLLLAILDADDVLEKHIVLAQLRAIDVLHPGTTRHA